MNRVCLTGRLTSDPEVRVSGETTVARFSIAVNRQYAKEGQQSADFINCVCFGKTAEHMEKYWSKGMKADVCGRWQTGSYKNKDGATVYTNDCYVEQIEFGERKSSNSNGSSNSSGGNDNAKATAGSDGFMNIPDGADDEGLPFA